eukprot:1902554-Prymnesium_polylepis.1
MCETYGLPDGPSTCNERTELEPPELARLVATAATPRSAARPRIPTSTEGRNDPPERRRLHTATGTQSLHSAHACVPNMGTRLLGASGAPPPAPLLTPSLPPSAPDLSFRPTSENLSS